MDLSEVCSSVSQFFACVDANGRVYSGGRTTDLGGAWHKDTLRHEPLEGDATACVDCVLVSSCHLYVYGRLLDEHDREGHIWAKGPGERVQWPRVWVCVPRAVAKNRSHTRVSARLSQMRTA